MNGLEWCKFTNEKKCHLQKFRGKTISLSCVFHFNIIQGVSLRMGYSLRVDQTTTKSLFENVYGVFDVDFLIIHNK